MTRTSGVRVCVHPGVHVVQRATSRYVDEHEERQRERREERVKSNGWIRRCRDDAASRVVYDVRRSMGCGSVRDSGRGMS